LVHGSLTRRPTSGYRDDGTLEGMSELPGPGPTARPTWIALATGGPVLALRGGIRIVRDAAAFALLLERARPHVAVVSEPPAGATLLDHLARERRRRPSLRIVHLAADDAVDARLHALGLGFDESLPASIDPDELAGRLTLLDRRAHARATDPILVARDLVLDLTAHELRRDGRTVHLRPKEFGLLAMLAAHPGRAYTRRQLLDRVWGTDHDGDPRTVDVHVRWLRSKIEPEPARPIHLVTLRGIGYRLDAPDGLDLPER
jgi:DNA-binding response OmpR family regulator